MARFGGAGRAAGFAATGGVEATGTNASAGTGGGIGARAGLREAGFLGGWTTVLRAAASFGDAERGLAGILAGLMGVAIRGWLVVGTRGGWDLALALDFFMAPAMALMIQMTKKTR